MYVVTSYHKQVVFLEQLIRLTGSFRGSRVFNKMAPTRLSCPYNRQCPFVLLTGDLDDPQFQQVSVSEVTAEG